jgi:hypothetical protein
MALANTIEFTNLADFYLDPTNPRLGRANAGPDVPQSRVMEIMRTWALDELAVSFLESGFWPQEAVIVVKEQLYGPPEKIVVVEGNRRIAALRYLQDAFNGNPVSRRWKELVDGATPPSELFTRIPYIIADSRADVTAFLGFRHVTGIKEWNPGQKAEYIAHLVDDLNMSYEEIRKKIGSRAETVRRNYIAYRIFQQLEEFSEQISTEKIEDRFSVLFLSLRERGVQRYLSVDIRAEPEEAHDPVPNTKLDDLLYYAIWLFGTDKKKPLFTDSRYVGDFGKVLESPEAVEYLKSSDEPSFELALQKAGIEEKELIQRVQESTDQIEQALGRLHLYTDSEDLQKVVRRFGLGARELLRKFPSILAETFGNGGDGTDA